MDKYVPAKMEIVELEEVDVLTTSSVNDPLFGMGEVTE